MLHTFTFFIAIFSRFLRRLWKMSLALDFFCQQPSCLSTRKCHWLLIVVSLCPYSPPELEDLRQALKWTQHCLTDFQSQQDVDLIMQLLVTENFRNAFSIYTAVSQQKCSVSPTSPLTVQAEDLCQEVGTVSYWCVYVENGSPDRAVYNLCCYFFFRNVLEKHWWLVIGPKKLLWG